MRNFVTRSENEKDRSESHNPLQTKGFVRDTRISSCGTFVTNAPDSGLSRMWTRTPLEAFMTNSSHSDECRLRQHLSGDECLWTGKHRQLQHFVRFREKVLINDELPLLLERNAREKWRTLGEGGEQARFLMCQKNRITNTSTKL